MAVFLWFLSCIGANNVYARSAITCDPIKLMSGGKVFLVPEDTGLLPSHVFVISKYEVMAAVIPSTKFYIYQVYSEDPDFLIAQRQESPNSNRYYKITLDKNNLTVLYTSYTQEVPVTTPSTSIYMRCHKG